MKNIFKKIHKDNNEKGSGIILVIVALSFLGIIAGALLTAVAYAYRLKLYDYNAKDNFHYVEQAMDEVYAGLGGRTTTTMQDAYTKTVESMVYFDTNQRAYVNIGDAAANKMFKDNFMNGIKNDTAFTNITTLSQLIQSYISNSSVEVVSDKMKVQYYDINNNIVMTVPGETMLDEIKNVELGKIVIQNLVLRRTANYERSTASGTFTQTISTDVEISRPDFNVQFNTVNSSNSVLYDYALIADSGVEINKSAASPLLINGNIYAGADFYNKGYNQYGLTSAEVDSTYAEKQTISDAKNADGSTSNVDVYMNTVSSKTHVNGGDTFLFNARLADQLYGNQDGVFVKAEYDAYKASISSNKSLLYNGYNENSKYSGLYINGAKVSIMADTLVVPGSIAVMNGANLSVYSNNGTKIQKSNVWADNVILGGYSVNAPTLGTSTTNNKFGSKATFVANMYVRDDLEINSDNSKFELIGNYYGYGNGTQTKRSFVPIVLTDENGINIYQQQATSNTYEDRSHYNSSAIVVNGQKSELDLSGANAIYVAGQAYLELSAKHQDVEVDAENGEIVYASGKDGKQAVTKEVITYDASKQDYRTGESISVKSNQLIYIPNGTGTYEDVIVGGVVEYQTIAISEVLLVNDSNNYNLFKAFFKNTTKVPCLSIVPAGSTRTYHYFDFERIYAEDDKGYDSPEAMAAAFATAYMAELNKSSSEVSTNYSPIKDYLDKDVTSGELFSAGQILLPEDSSVPVYASGALTSIVTSGGKNNYNIVVSTDSGITRPKTVEEDTTVGSTSSTAESILLAGDFTKHYNYLKFSLVDLAAGSSEASFVDGIVSNPKYGESALSPLNRYFIMKNLYEVRPATGSETGDIEHVLKLSSGYKVWITSNDVEIKASDCEDVDGQKVMRGIILTKGDVYFGAGVNRFEGLIIAGDKIYIGNDVSAISANPEVCKAIITELQMDKDVDAEKVLRTFVGYSSAYDGLSLTELKKLCDDRKIEYTSAEAENAEALITKLIAYDNNGDNKVKKIDTIDYSDVIRYSNWMKNSE